MKRNTTGFVYSTAFVFTILFSGLATAETPSFDYVQFDYLLSGDTEFSESGQSVEIDLANGYAIKGAFSAGNYFFVSGEAYDFNYEDEDGELLSAGDSIALNDLTFIGAGGHMPVGDVVELYAQLGLARATLADYAGDGSGFKLGATARVGIVDIGL